VKTGIKSMVSKNQGKFVTGITKRKNPKIVVMAQNQLF
jgi:hypothetical protein